MQMASVDFEIAIFGGIQVQTEGERSGHILLLTSTYVLTLWKNRFLFSPLKGDGGERMRESVLI